MKEEEFDDAGSVIKELYFTLFNKNSELQRMRISYTKNNYQIMYGVEADIPVASYTVNNKVIELMNEFKDAGISIFSEKVGDYNTVTTSFVGGAIMNDLIGRLEESTNKLKNIDNIIVQTVKKRGKRKVALQTMTPARRLWAKIRQFFGVDSAYEKDMKLLYDEHDDIDSAIQEYKDFVDEIWAYNLKDNILFSIAKEIVDKDYPECNIPGIIAENVAPVFEKLGLNHLVSQIDDEIDSYKKSKVENKKNDKFYANEEFSYVQFPSTYANNNVGRLTDEQRKIIQRKVREIAKQYDNIDSDKDSVDSDDKSGGNHEI